MIRTVRTCALNMTFNEGQGNPHDSSGYANVAVNHGATWVYGNYGWALQFNGAGNYVEITPNFLSNVKALTMIGWYNHDSTGSGTYETIIHKSTGGSIGSSDFWMGVCVNNYLCATIGASAGAGWAAGKTTTLAVDGTWYNMAAAWDGSVVRVYKNGVYNKQYNLDHINNITTPTRFGASAAGGGYLFKGKIGKALLYTESWSEADLLAYFNNTKAGYGL